MKTTMYLQQEKKIARADAGGMRERWEWGGRVLLDPDAFAPGSSQLKPRWAEQTIKAYAAAGRKLNEREIRRRIQCARTYKTESEFGRAEAEFGTWRDLSDANFPAFDGDPDEPLADHRTNEQKASERARLLTDLADWDAGQLPFPLHEFEPTAATLDELETWLKEQDDITAGFVRTSEKRHAYLDELKAAADGDLSMTWQEAHNRLADSEPPDA